MVAALKHGAPDLVDVGAPFYAGSARPGTAGAGQPVVHKFDRTDFVDQFLAELAGAAATSAPPPSLLGPLAAGGLDVDTDGLDFLDRRFRKLYQPAHFRFYLASCELRCLVPGFPAPQRKKVKKVELVIRRVAVTPDADGHAEVATSEQAWVTIPAPSAFPKVPPAGTAPVDLAPRLTGNTRTWWPVPSGVDAPEGEERFPMTRAFAAGLEQRAVYFGFLPLASGEMYGPRAVVDATAAPGSATAPIVEGSRPSDNKHPPTSMVAETIADYIGPDVAGGPPSALPPSALVPAQPLVPAPSSFSLTPASVRNWLRLWKSVLGLMGGTPNGPRPKFESPRIDGDVKKGFTGGWAYVVRCVATLELAPGCLVEHWGPSSPPSLVAPHFDPFGGRPTQIDIPSPAQIKAMLQGLAPNQIAKRGGLGTSMKNHGCPPSVDMSGGSVNVTIPDSCNTHEICFLGIPLITIVAYIMFSIGLVIVILLFPLQIFLSLKFCLPIGTEE